MNEKKEKANFERQLTDLRHEISICCAVQNVYYEVTRSRKPVSNSVPFRNVTDRRTKGKFSEMADGADKQRRVKDDNIKTSKIEADIAQSILKLMDLHTSPAVDLDVFNGNPLEYTYFKATFQDAVEGKIDDQKGRLTRLIKYTRGEAKDLIKEFIHEDTSKCYDLAIKALDDEYGNPQWLNSAYMRELKQWPKIRPNDVAGYRNMYRFLLKCKIINKQGKLQVLDTPEMIRLILSKFTTNIQDTWNKLTYKISNADSRDADFNDLVEFLHRQTSYLNNPEYSGEAFSDLREGRHESAHVKTYATKFDFDWNPHSAVQRYFCQESHTLENCQGIAALSISKKIEFIAKRKICFMCFRPMSKTHYANICKAKVQCEICNKIHPTLLHEYHRPVSVNALKSPNPSQFISSCVIPVLLYDKRYPDAKIEVYAMLDSCSQGTFIDDSILRKLMLTDTRLSRITIKTINGEETMNTRVMDNLVVCCNTECG